MGDDERQEQQDLYRAGPMPHLPESKDRDPEKREIMRKCQEAVKELERTHNYPAFHERNAEITLEHRHLYGQQVAPENMVTLAEGGDKAKTLMRPGEKREAFEARQREARRELDRITEANSHNAAWLRHCEELLAKRDERIEREGLQGADVQPEDDDIPF